MPRNGGGMPKMLLRGAAAAAYLAQQSAPEVLRRIAEADRDDRARERYLDVPPPVGSWEAEEAAVLAAACADSRFGGPAREYSDPLSTEDTPRPYHFSVLAAFPHDHKATISNSKSGAIYQAKYELASDGTVSFSEVTPAQIEITAKAAEALRAMREAGRKDPRHVPFTLYSRIAEAVENADGTWKMVALTVGPGNPLDANYYLPSFIDDCVVLLNGNRSNYDHPTPTQEREQPEGSVHRLAGWFKDATRDDAYVPPGATAAVPAVRATFVPRRGDERIISLIRTCQEHAAAFPTKPPLVAFSINGMGVGSVGEAPDGLGEMNLMEHMTSMASTDIVTAAGARGRFDFGGAPTVKTGKRSGTRESGAGATGFLRFAGGDVQLDLRSPEQTKEDDKKQRGVMRRAIAESALNGPNGTAIRKALGVDESKPTKDFTDSEISDVLGKLGDPLREGGPLDVALGTLATGLLARAARESAEDPDPDDDPDLEPDEDDPAIETGRRAIAHEGFSEAELKAMSPEARKKAKALMKASAKGSKESATQIATLQAQIDTIGKNNVLSAVMTQRKVDAAFRPVLEALCETATSPEQIDARVVAWARTLGSTDTPGAIGERAREHAGTSAGGYKPRYTKEDE